MNSPEPEEIEAEKVPSEGGKDPSIEGEKEIVFDQEVRERPADEDPEITAAWDAQHRERMNEW